VSTRAAGELISGDRSIADRGSRIADKSRGRMRDGAIRAAISRRIESAHARHRPAARNRIIQILTAAFYGSPPLFLVSPIFIANRRSIPCRPATVYTGESRFRSALREVAHFCANVYAVGPILRTLFGARNRRANTACMIPRFSSIFRSLDRVFCLLADLRGYSFLSFLPRHHHRRRRPGEKCIASSMWRTRARGRNLHVSIIVDSSRASSRSVSVIINNRKIEARVNNSRPV